MGEWAVFAGIWFLGYMLYRIELALREIVVLLKK